MKIHVGAWSVVNKHAHFSNPNKFTNPNTPGTGLFGLVRVHCTSKISIMWKTSFVLAMVVPLPFLYCIMVALVTDLHIISEMV